MSNTVYDISAFTHQEWNKYILDCNVLMYVFYTFGGYSNVIMDPYKTFFNNIATSSQCILFPAALASEFANTFIRNEYRRYLRQNGLRQRDFDFKKSYKPTSEYKATVNEIHDILNNQLFSLPSVVICNDKFDSIDIDGFFENENTFDFNDRYYGELSKIHDCYIVTNDKDFKSVDDIKIITSCSDMFSL